MERRTKERSFLQYDAILDFHEMMTPEESAIVSNLQTRWLLGDDNEDQFLLNSTRRAILKQMKLSLANSELRAKKKRTAAVLPSANVINPVPEGEDSVH